MSASTIDLGGITCMAEALVDVVARALYQHGLPETAALLGYTYAKDEDGREHALGFSRAAFAAIDAAGYAVVPKEPIYVKDDDSLGEGTWRMEPAPKANPAP